MTRIPALSILPLGLLALLAVRPGWAGEAPRPVIPPDFTPGVASDTPQLALPSSPAATPPGTESAVYKSWNEDTPFLTSMVTHEGTGGAVTDLENAFTHEAKKIESAVTKGRLHMLSKGDPKGTMGKAVKDGYKAMGRQSRYARWVKKAGKVLQVIDFVSTGAKAVGYLVEGDKTGAVAVIVDDAAKKGTVAIFSLGGSEIPVVGNMLAAALGEEFHKRTTGKAISKIETAARNKVYRDKYLGTRKRPTTGVGTGSGTGTGTSRGTGSGMPTGTGTGTFVPRPAPARPPVTAKPPRRSKSSTPKRRVKRPTRRRVPANQTCPRCGVHTKSYNTPLCNRCICVVANDYAFYLSYKKDGKESKYKSHERQYWKYIPKDARFSIK